MFLILKRPSTFIMYSTQMIKKRISQQKKKHFVSFKEFLLRNITIWFHRVSQSIFFSSSFYFESCVYSYTRFYMDEESILCPAMGAICVKIATLHENWKGYKKMPVEICLSGMVLCEWWYDDFCILRGWGKADIHYMQCRFLVKQISRSYYFSSSQ